MLIIMHFYPFRQVSHTILINSYFIFIFFKQEDGMRREHGQFYCGARYYCPASFCLSRTGFNMAAVPGDARASLLVPSCVIRVSSGWDHSDPGEKAGKGMEVVRIFCYRVLDWSASFIHPNFSLHPQVWSPPLPPPPPLFDKRYWKRYLLLMEFKVKYLIIFDLL